MLAVGPWLFGRGSKGVVLGEFRKRREGESRGRIRLFNSSPPSPERVREKLGSSLLACLSVVDSIRGDDNRSYSGYFPSICTMLKLIESFISVLMSLIFLTFVSIFVSGKLNLPGGFIIVDKGKSIIPFSK